MEAEHDTELQPEDGLIVRQFAAELTAGDGRTVDVRIVPYGETITHNDGQGGVPVGVPYREEFMPGVFAHQERAANRVLANFEHEPGIRGVIGHGLTLREGRDGFYGTFKIHDTPDGEKALILIREGVVDSVSLEARPQKSVRTVGGVIQRVKAHLSKIALTREGAYKGAKILALRSPAILDETLLPQPMDENLVHRLVQNGIKLPDHLAHPASGHPGTTGTPEDGTRPTSTSSEVTPDEQHRTDGDDAHSPR